MLDWLVLPIDPNRAHDVGLAVSWHARFMVLAWGVLAPLAVIAARFMKVLPGQDWPRELDNQTWWRSHLFGHALVIGITTIGFALVLPFDLSQMNPHKWLGYCVLLCLALQVGLGVMRGDKGGPTARATDGSLRGHHYDMTLRRIAFEVLHKSLGYALLILSVVTILYGLWDANGPRWMWAGLGLWWLALIGLFCILQKRGMAVDTYQAIWGNDPIHPGNQRPAPKWGMNRPVNDKKGDDDVRRDRGDRLQSH